MKDGKFQVSDLFYGILFTLFIYSSFMYIWNPKIEWIYTGILSIFWFYFMCLLEKMPTKKEKED